MSSDPNPTPHPSPHSSQSPSTPDDSLQFDRAEFNAGSALTCSFCKAPVTGQYFQVNEQTVCPSCRQQIDTAISGGSKPLRALRALAAGIGAAIAGFLIYWAIRALTGYEFALVAIAIGFMVGAAVRWGAQSRGGIFYQLMAVILTYLSIASNYTPDVLQGMRQGQAEQIAPENASADSAIATDADITAADTNALAAAPTAEPADSEIPLWFALPFAFIISLAVPFMGGLNLIGWLIIGFGLLQAWNMNKRVPIQVSGPFDTGTPAPAAPRLQT